MYFYNGKIFGLRGGDHRKIVVNNFEIGPNFIKFEENASKTYYGGICDLKYVPRKVKHVCHSIGEKHESSRCLVEIYTLYIGLVETHAKAVTAFYFKPSTRRLAFEKVPVGINSLNKILPEMCESAGFKRKTAHSLRFTCVSSLFNAGVDEKLIRERSGASYSGQVDGFRNPMKNELKTRPCLKPVFETKNTCTDANFLNLHIDKATKTRGDKQLYLITHFTKQTLHLNYLLLKLNVTEQFLKNPKQKRPFFFNSRSMMATSCFWFTFNLAGKSFRITLWRPVLVKIVIIKLPHKSPFSATVVLLINLLCIFIGGANFF